MKLKITLLSDLCTGSGETFNSTVDTDVVYDDFGLPYIPAKRLKGCIREACLELEEFGAAAQGSVRRIFGEEGNSPSEFALSDACLEDYELIWSDLQKAQDPALTHSQNVLGLYTYTRTQTSLDAKRGTALKNTLRTQRVIRAGLVFEADLYCREDMSDEDRELLKTAAEMVVHMGIHRTRGLGTVRVECTDDEMTKRNTVEAGTPGERNRLEYVVQLLTPMLCKSAEGDQAKTQPYIEGGKVLGMLAGVLGKEGFARLTREELIVSNAYILHGKKRCTPLSASLQKQKDQPFDANGEMRVRDMLYTGSVNEQMTPVGGSFVDPDGYLVSVETEIHYHHRRPEDKSTGRADGKDGSAFYQLESIRAGQAFGGYILASREQAEVIGAVFRGSRNVRMGYSRNAQYGEVLLSMKGQEIKEAQTARERVHEFRVKLNAPVILYNENGMYSSDIRDLKAYLEEALNVRDLVIGKPFLNYETVGGFNVTWGHRKPVFTALGRGSVCTFHSETGIVLPDGEGLFIGERVSEGYGEIEIRQDQEAFVTLREAKTEGPEISDEDRAKRHTDILSRLARRQCEREIEAAARETAEKAYGSIRKQPEADASVARLIRISREQDTFRKMKEQASRIETDAKRKLAERMTDDIGGALSREYPYMDRIEEKQRLTEHEIYQKYSTAYLRQLKYLLRPGREERRKAHE